MVDILSLVAGDGVKDARVTKEALALAALDHRVRIFCRSAPDEERTFTQNGVEYQYVDTFAVRDAPESVMKEALAPFGSRAGEVGERVARVLDLRRRLDASRARVAQLNEARTASRSVWEKRVLAIQIRDEREVLAECSDRWRQAGDDLYYARFVFFALRLLERPVEMNPRVVHAHDLYTVPAAVALARRHDAKVIYDAHEIETERVPPLPDDRKAFIAGLEKSLALQIDAMVVVCDSARDFYEAHMGHRAAVVMNSPAFESAGEFDTSLDIRNALPNDGRKVIAYTGGIGLEGRGLHIVADALRQLPDCNLVILGPQHERDKWLFERAEELGVKDRIYSLPPVPQQFVVGAIRSADVSICPIQDVSLSYRFAMPNKLFEATFAELPICASNLPEMARFVTALGNGVTMDQTDPDDMARKVRHVLEHRQRYALNDQSREILRSVYCWDRQVENLADLYARLLTNARSPEQLRLAQDVRDNAEAAISAAAAAQAARAASEGDRLASPRAAPRHGAPGAARAIDAHAGRRAKPRVAKRRSVSLLLSSAAAAVRTSTVPKSLLIEEGEAAARLKEARKVYASADNEMATRLFEQALLDGVDEAACVRHLARLANRTKNWAEARIYWSRMCELDAAQAEPWLQAARLDAKDGDLPAAAAKYEIGLKQLDDGAPASAALVAAARDFLNARTNQIDG